LPLSILFSALGLKSEKKILASISLGIAIGLLALIIGFVVFMMVSLA
jgi:hypothetical protein